jgi:aminopeptidase N
MKAWNKLALGLLALGFTLNVSAQTLHTPEALTHQDTLRGSIGNGRIGWDVLHYEITVKPDYLTKSIVGENILRFFDRGVKTMQLDLQMPMLIDSIISVNKALRFSHEGNVYWVNYRDEKVAEKMNPKPAEIKIYFHGVPTEAKNPPWDGGWIWKKDDKGNPWMSVACQGLGASVWYPCKDHQSDEPDSGAVLHMIIPDTLVGVGNGRLKEKSNLGKGLVKYTWQVKNPINNYNIIPYIGKYVHFGEQYQGEKGQLDMDYWILDYNLEKAKSQFKDATRTMKAFEHWFGPYPFYEDGYKLVESPHLGMEHQSAVAYGNAFQNGYRGRDLSGTGWGLKFDFIIVHESGHEWFGNNITSIDLADMWIHESFTNYSETLFTDFYYGKEAGNDYVVGTRKGIRNDNPIIGQYGVNKEGSGDMYPKGGNMLHTIRQVIDNDKKFRAIWRGLNQTFYHQMVSAAQIENYISKKSKKDLSKVFDQYLRTIQIPILEYKREGNQFSYRWTNCVAGFNLPIKVTGITKPEKTKWLKPTTEWQVVKIPNKYSNSAFAIDRNFYVDMKQIK